MDFEQKLKTILMKEQELNKREEKLNEIEREIKKRESGICHYYIDFINEMQEKHFRHSENHHYGCQLE